MCLMTFLVAQKFVISSSPVPALTTRSQTWNSVFFAFINLFDLLFINDVLCPGHPARSRRYKVE